MSTNKRNFNDLFRILRTRPDMLLIGDTSLLDTYISFFEGYFLGIKMFIGHDLERNLSAWYQNKVEFKASSLYWFAQFKQIHVNELEKNKIVLLLDLLEQFFMEEFPNSSS